MLYYSTNLFTAIPRNFITFFNSSELMSLNTLAIKHGTDKSSQHHGYADIYENYLPADLDGLVLELGIGGYQYPNKGGNSLRMWREYFTKATIRGVDKYEKDFTIPGVDMYFGTIPQGDYDVIIDDASHVNHETIENFKTLFRFLKPGGLYFVEDIHTSYWLDNYSGDPDPAYPHTAMNFFLTLCHQLNHETLLAEYKNEYAGQIEFIHFYRQLVVIKKSST